MCVCAFKKVKISVRSDDLREFSLRQRSLPIDPTATMTDDWLNKRQNERLVYKENIMSNECVCEELSNRSLFFFLLLLLLLWYFWINTVFLYVCMCISIATYGRKRVILSWSQNTYYDASKWPDDDLITAFNMYPWPFKAVWTFKKNRLLCAVMTFHVTLEKTYYCAVWLFRNDIQL